MININIKKIETLNKQVFKLFLVTMIFVGLAFPQKSSAASGGTSMPGVMLMGAAVLTIPTDYYLIGAFCAIAGILLLSEEEGIQVGTFAKITDSDFVETLRTNFDISSVELKIYNQNRNLALINKASEIHAIWYMEQVQGDDKNRPRLQESASENFKQILEKLRVPEAAKKVVLAVSDLAKSTSLK